MSEKQNFIFRNIRSQGILYENVQSLRFYEEEHLQVVDRRFNGKWRKWLKLIYTPLYTAVVIKHEEFYKSFPRKCLCMHF